MCKYPCRPCQLEQTFRFPERITARLQLVRLVNAGFQPVIRRNQQHILVFYRKVTQYVKPRKFTLDELSRLISKYIDMG